MSGKRVSKMSNDEVRAMLGANKAITMPHSCEVTADRLLDAMAAHFDRFTGPERAAITEVVAGLRRIAAGDRERMEAQS